MTFDFVAIDFETANDNNNSACSLGMVMVKDKQIVDKKYFLIHPPTSKFNPGNINVHGITYDDVKDAPRFPWVWNQIKNYFKDNIIVAHNAHFDMSVLKCCLEEYELDYPNFEYICSIPISTKACEGMRISQSLVDRANYFGIKLENHHNSLEDAEACAKIVIETVNKVKRKSFDSFCRVYSSLPIRYFSDLKPSRGFRTSKYNKRFQNVAISEISATSFCIDTSNKLFGKNVVFTGELKNMERREAMQKVVNLGGILKSSVSSKTDYLVVGVQDNAIVGDDGLSSKEEKAYDLISKGIYINIITENEFLDIINK